MSEELKPSVEPSSRRDFLKSTAAAGASAAVLTSTNYAWAQGSDSVKVGLVGCGGRGTGAAADALQAGPEVHLTAVADVYKAQGEKAVGGLKGSPDLGAKVNVQDAKIFAGLDAYQDMMASDVDVVLLATPPGFRPLHVKAAVAAGKHIFAEKPLGTDVVNTLAAMEALKNMRKDRCFSSGFCYRYAEVQRAFYTRLHQGAIGPVRFVHATYLTGPVKPMPPASTRPAGMSDVEWQVRNWYNFVWLCGDGLVEQACHSVDKILWAMKDVAPTRCVATGGRIHPNNEGNILDHIDVFYEWADGSRATMAQRQIANMPHNDNSDYIVAAEGTGKVTFANAEMSGKTNWRSEPAKKSMYALEHDFLFAAIKNKKPFSDAEKMGRSTLAGIMGRMAAYTGEAVTWDAMLKSNEDLFPKDLKWNGSLPIPPMARPGKPPLG